MKSVLLIGIGGFGMHLAKELHQLGHQVMAVDRVEERINSVLPWVTEARIGDSTSQAFLETLGIHGYDLCIVTVENDFQSSLETTSLLKELGARYVVSRAARDVQEKFLLRNGADEVVCPDKQLARWTAFRYTADHILDYIELDSGHAIFEVPVPKAWLGKTVGQLDVRKKYNVNIMGFKRDGKLNVEVTPATVLSSDITLLAVGEYKTLQRCFRGAQ